MFLPKCSSAQYYAIVHPLESRVHHSKARAKRILLSVWALPCLVAAPNLYPARAVHLHLYSQYGAFHRLTCLDNLDRVNEHFRTIYFSILFLLIYLLPLGFIAGTCFHIAHVLLKGIYLHRQGSLRRQENNRRKVAKMVMVVVVAFTVSWTPYFLVTIVTQCHNFMAERHFFFTMLTINFLAFTNSCVNPFIYAAMSARFRHGFQSLLCFRKRPHRGHRGGSRCATNHRGPGSFSEGSCSLGSAPSTRSSPQYSIFRLESLRKFSRRTLALALRAGGSSRKKRQAEDEVTNNANTLNSAPPHGGRCTCHAALSQLPEPTEEKASLPLSEFQLQAMALEASLTAFLVREADRRCKQLFPVLKTETKSRPLDSCPQYSPRSPQPLTASASMPSLHVPILPFIDESIEDYVCPTVNQKIHRWASEGALTRLKETAL